MGGSKRLEIAFSVTRIEVDPRKDVVVSSR